MKKIYVLLSVITLFTCANFEKGPEQLFLYEVQSKEPVSSGSMTKTLNIIKKRLNNLGVKDVEVGLNNKNEIEVKTRTKLEENRLNNIVLNQGKLEFWETYKSQDFMTFFSEYNAYLKEENNEEDSAEFIFDLIASMGYGSAVNFTVKTKDTAKLSAFLRRKEVRSFLPSNKKYVKFLWGIRDDNEEHPLYVVKYNSEGVAPITVEHITDAAQNLDMRRRPSITMKMDESGAAKWERMTGNAYRNQTYIAITLNNIVYSAPSVSAGPITGGNTEVTGEFSLQQAQNLAAILSSGGRIPKLKFLGSTILEDSKD